MNEAKVPTVLEVIGVLIALLFAIPFAVGAAALAVTVIGGCYYLVFLIGWNAIHSLWDLLF